MATNVRYRDIPRDERKRLEVEAYRQSRRLRVVRNAAVLIPILLAGTFAREIAPVDSIVARLAVAISGAVLASAVIWELLGRPRLKAEVERLRNAR